MAELKKATAVKVKAVKTEAPVAPEAPKEDVTVEASLSGEAHTCLNCGHQLEGSVCPACGFDASLLVNYHDL